MHIKYFNTLPGTFTIVILSLSLIIDLVTTQFAGSPVYASPQQF